MSDSRKQPNGCGPWWVPRKWKDEYFVQECRIHDEDYLDPSKNGRDRKQADKFFYKQMLAKVSLEKNYFKRQMRKAQAWAYYHIVRNFGWTSHKDGLDL